MSHGKIFSLIEGDLALLEGKLLQAVRGAGGIVSEIGEHLVSSGGKRVRPALCIMAARCGNAFSLEKVLPLATALELIHMASLVHDDVIDEAALRRGMPTANAKWGSQISILAGDFIFARAFGIVAKENYDRYIDRRLADLVVSLSVGEITQDQEAYKALQDMDNYYARIKMKTADFLEISCELGAMVGGLEISAVKKLASYGHAIGMAFQITDDLLDIVETEERIGKPVGSDIRQGLATLPAIWALSVSPKRGRLQEILMSPNMTNADVEEAITIIRAAEAEDFAREKAALYLSEAKESLPQNLPPEMREAFLTVADFIGSRNF